MNFGLLIHVLLFAFTFCFRSHQIRLHSHSHLLSNQATSQSVDAVERQSFMNSVEGLVGLYVLTREEGAEPAGRSRTRKKQAPFCLSKKNKRTIIFRPRLGSARRASSIPYLYLLYILSSVNPPFSPWQIYHPCSFQSCLALHAQCSSSYRLQYHHCDDIPT